MVGTSNQSEPEMASEKNANLAGYEIFTAFTVTLKKKAEKCFHDVNVRKKKTLHASRRPSYFETKCRPKFQEGSLS
jgi:hypothetical protein